MRSINDILRELDELFTNDPELSAILKTMSAPNPEPPSVQAHISLVNSPVKTPLSIDEINAEFGQTLAHQPREMAPPAKVQASSLKPIAGSHSTALYPVAAMITAEGTLPTVREFSVKREPAWETRPEKAPRNKGENFLRKIFNILFYVLIIAIIGGAVLFALSKDPGKSYFGYRLYTVRTPSMAPRTDGGSPPGGFNAGDAILVKICNPGDIQVGDIITYIPGDDPSVYLTHRVVKVLDHLNDDQGIFFVTRGDANDADDPPIKGDMVVGKKVLVIPGTGVVLQFIRDNLMISVLLVVSGIGCIILLQIYFSGPAEKIAKKKRYV